MTSTNTRRTKIIASGTARARIPPCVRLCFFSPSSALSGCDSVVSNSGTDGEASTGAPTSGPSTSLTATLTDTSPSTTVTTTGIDPSSTTDSPLTTGREDSTGELGSSSGGGSGSGSGSSSSSGSGSSTSGSSSSTDTTDTTGVLFIDPSDTGPGVECDTYSDDCPDGEKCNPWSNDGGGNWNALDCFPIDPSPAQVGDACEVEGAGTSGIDTCDLGSMCWDVDQETNVGVCVAFCDGSPDMPACADPDLSCTIVNDGVLNLCLPGCDPLL